jgi:molybdopterin/thiamine biosynthesis adenylyltransferase
VPRWAPSPLPPYPREATRLTVTLSDRFSRQRLIDGWNQDVLAQATIVVAGVGALGNEVAKNLALAGVGRLILCDPDTIETTNLSRTVLFGPDDVARPKVAAAADAIVRMGTGTVPDPRPVTLTAGVGLGELADADLVLGCLDSRQVRLELLGRCALVNAALIDGGTGPWSGELRVRTDVESACYACSFSPFERAESDLPRSCAEVQPPGAQPASIATTSLVGSWMTMGALRILLGQPVPYRVLWIDAALGTTAPVVITRDPGCPHHQPIPPADATLSVTHRDLVSSLFTALPPGSDPVAWATFPTIARCQRCHQKMGYNPATGYGLKKSPGGLMRCERCEAILRPQMSRRLADADPTVRLCDVSVAPQEILPVRLPDGDIRWLRLGA